jgi:hypothetical protein
MINWSELKQREQIVLLKFLQVRSNPIEWKIISAIKCNFETEKSIEKHLSDFISWKEFDYSEQDNHYFLVLSVQHNIPTTKWYFRSDNCDNLELHIWITKEHYEQVASEISNNKTNDNDLSLFSKHFDITKITWETILKLRETRIMPMWQKNGIVHTLDFQARLDDDRKQRENVQAMLKFTEMLKKFNWIDSTLEIDSTWE